MREHPEIAEILNSDMSSERMLVVQHWMEKQDDLKRKGSIVYNKAMALYDNLDDATVVNGLPPLQYDLKIWLQALDSCIEKEEQEWLPILTQSAHPYITQTIIPRIYRFAEDFERVRPLFRPILDLENPSIGMEHTADDLDQSFRLISLKYAIIELIMACLILYEHVEIETVQEEIMLSEQFC